VIAELGDVVYALMWAATIYQFVPGPWNGKRRSDIRPMFPRRGRHL
jgi:hypothetical protein